MAQQPDTVDREVLSTPDSSEIQPSVERVRFDVPSWVRRVGTNSWMFIGTVLALAVITVMIAATRDLTIPLAIGIFLAIVFAPFVDWLEDRGIKRGAGAGIVLVGLVAVIVGCGWITAEALYSQGDALTENLQGAVEEVKTWVEDLPISAAAVDEVDSTAHDAAPVARDGVATAVATLFDSAAGMIAGLVLGAMVLYYILKDGATLTRKWVDRKADPARRDAAERVIDKSVNDIQSYFGGQTALALVNGVSIAPACTSSAYQEHLRSASSTSSAPTSRTSGPSSAARSPCSWRSATVGSGWRSRHLRSSWLLRWFSRTCCSPSCSARASTFIR